MVERRSLSSTISRLSLTVSARGALELWDGSAGMLRLLTTPSHGDGLRTCLVVPRDAFAPILTQCIDCFGCDRVCSALVSQAWSILAGKGGRVCTRRGYVACLPARRLIALDLPPRELHLKDLLAPLPGPPLVRASCPSRRPATPPAVDISPPTSQHHVLLSGITTAPPLR